MKSDPLPCPGVAAVSGTLGQLPASIEALIHSVAEVAETKRGRHLAVYLDEHQHPSQSLLNPLLGECQGPALCFFLPGEPDSTPFYAKLPAIQTHFWKLRSIHEALRQIPFVVRFILALMYSTFLAIARSARLIRIAGLENRGSIHSDSGSYHILRAYSKSCCKKSFKVLKLPVTSTFWALSSLASSKSSADYGRLSIKVAS